MRTWPFRALMPWAESRTVWHGWGDQMAGALAPRGTRWGNGRWVNATVAETGSFTPHLLAQGGPDNGWLPAPIDTTQIAYGADATLQNLLSAHDATGRVGVLELAGVAAAWYFANNPAGAQMYDPTTGRTFDGINPDGVVNRNSAVQADAGRRICASPCGAPSSASSSCHVTCALRSATRARLASCGRASSASIDNRPWIVDSARRKPVQWRCLCRAGPSRRGAHVGRAPTTDRYDVMPVFWREPDTGGSLRQRLRERPAGRERLGGAGPAWRHTAGGGTSISGPVEPECRWRPATHA